MYKCGFKKKDANATLYVKILTLCAKDNVFVCGGGGGLELRQWLKVQDILDLTTFITECCSYTSTFTNAVTYTRYF